VGIMIEMRAVFIHDVFGACKAGGVYDVKYTNYYSELGIKISCLVMVGREPPSHVMQAMGSMTMGIIRTPV